MILGRQAVSERFCHFYRTSISLFPIWIRFELAQQVSLDRLVRFSKPAISCILAWMQDSVIRVFDRRQKSPGPLFIFTENTIETMIAAIMRFAHLAIEEILPSCAVSSTTISPKP